MEHPRVFVFGQEAKREERQVAGFCWRCNEEYVVVVEGKNK